eukprot:TRINITY_DN4243_c0_g1_i1.p1 TRINITY_DN4243_c0_g1~~TRINITY_DN4243_c0_g1_i1.p1  ORF type:complete len:524 (+),score=135.95 TRINITY_DN4243_c0_g1_i1:218-1789(+)
MIRTPINKYPLRRVETPKDKEERENRERLEQRKTTPQKSKATSVDHNTIKTAHPEPTSIKHTPTTSTSPKTPKTPNTTKKIFNKNVDYSKVQSKVVQQLSTSNARAAPTTPKTPLRVTPAKASPSRTPAKTSPPKQTSVRVSPPKTIPSKPAPSRSASTKTASPTPKAIASTVAKAIGVSRETQTDPVVVFALTVAPTQSEDECLLELPCVGGVTELQHEISLCKQKTAYEIFERAVNDGKQQDDTSSTESPSDVSEHFNPEDLMLFWIKELPSSNPLLIAEAREFALKYSKEDLIKEIGKMKAEGRALPRVAPVENSDSVRKVANQPNAEVQNTTVVVESAQVESASQVDLSSVEEPATQNEVQPTEVEVENSTVVVESAEPISNLNPVEETQHTEPSLQDEARIDDNVEAEVVAVEHAQPAENVELAAPIEEPTPIEEEIIDDQIPSDEDFDSVSVPSFDDDVVDADQPEFNEDCDSFSLDQLVALLTHQFPNAELNDIFEIATSFDTTNILEQVAQLKAC